MFGGKLKQTGVGGNSQSTGWGRQRGQVVVQGQDGGGLQKGQREQADEVVSASACQFAGHQRRFSLGQVLRGGDVVARDLRLLRCRRRRQLFVLDLGFGHVVVTGVKVLLLQRERRDIQIF